MTVLGAGLLWFGWFGFNAGSALTAGGLAASAFIVTNTAAAAATITWVLASYLHKRKVSVVGAACGAVAGLVAITPASGFVTAGGALIIGLVAGGLCYSATLLRARVKVDDALDVFAVHGVGGMFGRHRDRHLRHGRRPGGVLGPHRRQPAAGRHPARRGRRDDRSTRSSPPSSSSRSSTSSSGSASRRGRGGRPRPRRPRRGRLPGVTGGPGPPRARRRLDARTPATGRVRPSRRRPVAHLSGDQAMATTVATDPVADSPDRRAALRRALRARRVRRRVRRGRRRPVARPGPAAGPRRARRARPSRRVRRRRRVERRRRRRAAARPLAARAARPATCAAAPARRRLALPAARPRGRARGATASSRTRSPPRPA